MNNSRHRIEIYEPEEFTTQQLKARGVSVIQSPEHKGAYLLTLEEPLGIDDEKVHEIVLRPRHDDPIERCVSSTCTVVISCVKPGISLASADEYQYTDVVNWGIGKITPIVAESGD
jgi:hypothetical protein